MKKSLMFFAFLLIILQSAVYAQFSGGDGSVGNPYQVADGGQLSFLRNYPGNYFIQIADIDLAWGGEGWYPIGINAARWTGNFNGNGYKITNLAINRPSTNYVGLFGYIENSTIQNVYLENVSITGAGGTGALVGVSGSSSSVINCYSTGTVYGADAVGGLVGWVMSSSVLKSYTTCNVTGNKNIGGLVGRTDSVVSIYDCYARGNVTGNSTDTFNNVGGLIGLCYDTDVARCYSTGYMTGYGSFTGGLIGYNNFPSATVNSFWDTESSGKTTSAGGIGKTTAEMKIQTTFTGWDFGTPVWRIYPTLNNGYPYLAFQDMPGILTLVANPSIGGTITGEGAYEGGSPVSLTATPQFGYVFLSWTNNVGIVVSSDANFTYTMPEGDMTLTANFDLYLSPRPIGFVNAAESSTIWGDYDNDGDLDMFVAGWNGSASKVAQRVAKIYRNDGADVFTDIGASISPVRYSSSAWGDYDNDGLLDLLVTGWEDGGITSKIYRNNGGDYFYNIGAGLPGINSGSVAWADFDNDGDLDITLSGYYSDGGYSITSIFRNTGGTFTDIGAGLTGLQYSSVAWGDYDNDGDLDLLACGLDNSSADVSVLYNNNNGVFTDVEAGFRGLYTGTAAWGDYENDGDIDILLTGIETGGKKYTEIYRNDGTGFTDIGAGIEYVSWSSAAWADIDNDGILDIIISGENNDNVYITKAYNIFSDTIYEKTNISLEGVRWGSLGCGDYDNDGDLDLIVSGFDSIDHAVTKLYKNNYRQVNTAPVPPTNLSWILNENDVTLSWNRTTDSQTPQYGLSYNLYIGTTPLNGNIKNAMSNYSTGFRKIVALGNAAQVNTWKINDLPLGTYYWSVQAIDHSYIGSDFASEGTFIVSSFTEMSSGLPALQYSSNAWADYDGDNDLDLLVTGYSTAYVTEIYRNDSGTFTDIDAGLTGVRTGSAAWGDYDNDGDPDILLTGNPGSGFISKIYRNDSGSFTDIAAGLPGVNNSAVAWGDYDNDGDLDLILTGYIDGTNRISNIYRNDSGVFTNIAAGLPGVNSGSVAWGDYDNDGDLDLLLTGAVSGSRISKIYRNDSGYFFDISASLTAINAGTAVWGDYDNDGDLDILLSGYNISKVYRNDSGNFSDIGTGLTGLFYSSGAWGDYDNDGDLDILLAGYVNATTRMTSIYRNDGGWFGNINAGLTGIQDGSVSWADYDNDGDLDIYYNGYNGTVKVSKLLRNNSVIKNTVPTAPTGLSTVIHRDGSVTFSWNRASDAQTPQYGLSYNLYIGSAIQGVDQMTPMSELTGGFRKVVNIGNANQCTSWTIRDLPVGHFYWSVQAVDHAFAGSQFAAEQEYSAFSEDFSANIQGVSYSSASWGDYDSDGDIDLVTTGYYAGWTYSNIYRNNLMGPKDDKIGPFTDISAGLDGVQNGSSSWGDYDNDGDLDLVITGNSYSYGIVSRIYRNDGGIFNDISAGILGVHYSSTAWGDYDNDGDLDLLITGHNGSWAYSIIYQNNAGIFTNISAPLEGVHAGSGTWGDYDNDGDLDILLTGYSSYTGYTSKIYRNDSGGFTDISAPIENVDYSSGNWGDYDNDGDLDILLTGYNGSTYVSRIYRNDSGLFTDISALLESVYLGSGVWGDYDNDGDLDILLTGYNLSGYYVSKVYRNDSGNFSDISALMTGVNWGTTSACWGDYDNDGDLDAFVAGYSIYGPSSFVYKNNTTNPNDALSAPTDLVITGKLDNAEFTFSPGPGKSPAESYTYNMDVAISGVNVKTSMAEHSGYRKIVELGNLNFGNSADKKGPVPSSWNLLKNMPNTVLPQEVLLVEAAVQSIDNSFAGSDFTTASAYLANRDLKTLPKDVMLPADELIWELFWSDSLESYTLQVDEDPLFGTPFEETQYLIAKDPKIIYVATELQNLSFFSGMSDNTTYYWRVRPNHRNHSKTTVFNSQPDSFLYKPVLSAPLNVSVVSVVGNSVTLSWDPVLIPDVEYSVYSSSLPYASFPSEWTLEASKLGNTTCTVNSGTAMKFFIVTATNDLKRNIIERNSSIK